MRVHTKRRHLYKSNIERKLTVFWSYLRKNKRNIQYFNPELHLTNCSSKLN